MQFGGDFENHGFDFRNVVLGRLIMSLPTPTSPTYAYFFAAFPALRLTLLPLSPL
jgi:hypothetical protein